MKFRLTYEGELYSTQRDPEAGQRNPNAEHKHSIRREFHHQLRRLWSENRFLRECKVYRNDWGLEKPAGEATWGAIAPNSEDMIRLHDAVASNYEKLGYRFVPLVIEKYSLLCSMDILFLRRDPPGSVINAGDIDNRVKTLIDALRLPQHQNELVGGDETPRADEDPFYCLLQDDKQVTRLSVDTDILLDPNTESNTDQSRVKLVITVELHPYTVTMFNLGFA